jgi:ABC-type branched-subunit amino acid transport system substrate-binding protein
MKRINRILLILVMVLALLLAACQGPAEAPAPEVEEVEEAAPAEVEEEAEEEMAEEEMAEEEMAEEEMAEEEEAMMEEVTLTLGYTASITGKYEVSSGRQVNGLNLWMGQVNGAGGFQVGDNTMVTFESVSYDDESAGERVQELYTRLATEDNADFLISPYSSGLTGSTAPIAEQYSKVMITTGAADDDAYKQGYTSIYQMYTPASRYLLGALDMLAATDPDVSKLAIVHENDRFSTAAAESAKDYAETLGYEVVVFEGYDSETTDFGPFINKIEAAAPEALIGGGHYEDGTTFARQLYEKGVDLGYVALLVAPADTKFAELGDAALGLIGPSQWEPGLVITPEAAEAAGVEWYGPTTDEFVAAYEAEYGETPTYHAAGGYIAGLVLQKAIENAGSTDPEAVKAALDAMDILTFYGHIKFDTSPEAHGLQIGHSMVYGQWQEGDEGLVRVVVWPAEGAQADVLYPIP